MDGLTHPNCRSKYAIDGAFSSIDYRNIAKKLIYQFKYKPHLSDLKTVLIDLLYEGIIQHETLMKAFDQKSFVLTAVPLHNARLKARGYNQSEILAKGLAKKLKIGHVQLLKRVKNTKTQVGLDRKKRMENISGAFSVAPNILLSQYLNILLVDDVLTTGSTLLGAARMLKRGGAKRVYGVTLARD